MKAWTYDFSKLVSWLFLRLGFGLEVRGQEHVPARDACIVAANHVSFLDPLVVGVACPRRLTFMARNTLFEHPLLAAWLRAVGAIAVRRGEADPSAVRSAIQHLRDGTPLALFPEGGRQFSGMLGIAKRGVGLLAVNARVPIVPVYLHGTFGALPPHEKCFHRTKIRVAFGPLIPYTEAIVPSSAPSAEPPTGNAGTHPLRADQERLAQAVTEAWRRLEQEMRETGAS